MSEPSSAPLWQAEKTLSASDAEGLVLQQFPELAPLELKSIGAGWDNTVFLSRQGWAFRFPRRQLALALTAQEWQVLEQLAQTELPLNIPRPIWQGKPQAPFNWPFYAYNWLPGETLCRSKLTPAERCALARPLADFLKTLHRLNIACAGDQLQRLDLTRRWPQVQTQLAHLQQTEALPFSPKELALLLNSLPTKTAAPRPAVLVHGDLYARHLIIQKGQLTGIIDWGDVHRGDPALDLAAVYSCLPPESHAAFWQTYGPVDAETVALTRFRALYSSLMILHYGQHENDTPLFAAGRQGLRWLLESI